MNETKKRIIEAAIALITEKGFHATSIQDITDHSDISKGAFYLHFKSKDDLHVEIFRYYSTLIREEMERTNDPALSPADNYRRETETQINQFLRHTDFIVMYIREQAFSMNKELIGFVEDLRTEQAKWYRNHLTAMYGDEIIPYVYDIATIIEGVKSSYMQLFISKPDALSTATLSRLLMNLTEQEADSFLTGKSQPLLDEQMVQTLFSNLLPEDGNTLDAQAVLESMHSTARRLPLPQSTASYLGATIGFLKEQATTGSEADRTAVLGAISVFRPYPEFQDHIRQLETIFGIQKD